mgnify:CR=1 FL=1
MKLTYPILMAVTLIGLSGCNAKTAAMEKQLADVQTQNTGLEARIVQLESRVQALEASLPEDNSGDQ